MRFTQKQQAEFLALVRRYRQIHRDHLRTEKEDEALHKTLVEMMGEQTRIAMTDAEGHTYIITITTQERMRVNPTLLLAHHPTIYDEVLSLSTARMLHIEFLTQDPVA